MDGGILTYCNIHGPHRYRPSVERFGAEQQAAFRRFCGSLLRFVNAPRQERPLLSQNGGKSTLQ
ncbi:hypothetical protein EPO15_10320 [bacterium]|nr:MAG: hypothetical protein EPO15_10320 [bacterium]